jgi:hypothetical protein
VGELRPKQTVYANRDAIILQSSTIRDTFFRPGSRSPSGLGQPIHRQPLNGQIQKGYWQIGATACHRAANHPGSDACLTSSHLNILAIPIPKHCRGSLTWSGLTGPHKAMRTHRFQFELVSDWTRNLNSDQNLHGDRFSTTPRGGEFPFTQGRESCLIHFLQHALVHF